MRRVSVCGLVTSLVIGSVAGAQTPASQQVEWPYFGGDRAARAFAAGRYRRRQRASGCSRLAVEALGDTLRNGTTPGLFENTPLMIDGVLYVTTPYNSIAALDAETGRELWRFDGEAYELGQLLSGSGWKLRGTAFWRDGGQLRVLPEQPASPVLAGCRAPASRCRRLATAARCRSPRACRGSADITHATQSSPPVVYRDLVIVGSQVPDRVQLPDPLG